MRRVLAVLAAGLLLFSLSGCLPDDSVETDPGTVAPVGPEPAPSGPLSLQSVMAIVGAGDTSATMSFTAGTELSTSGDDLDSEKDYFTGNGGTPAGCAGVVSAPYLVSAHDTGARLDDPSYLVGTFTELDENRFGLIQVYARQFDDAATGSAFFSEFTAAVKGCHAYQLFDGTTVTVNVVKLAVSTIRDLPDGVTGLHYVETLSGGASTHVTVDFYAKDGIVVSVYGELTANSTITQRQVDAMGATVADRLGIL